jgi:hypothetical protein
VGNIATAVAKLMPVLLRPTFAKSGPAADAFGVGHIASRRFRHATPRLIIDGHIWLALVVGVGNDPDALTAVWRTNG